MITKVVNLSGSMCVIGNPTNCNEFIAEWELRVNRCDVCGQKYNHRLHILEYRPVLPMDAGMPTLYILPNGTTRGYKNLGTGYKKIFPEMVQHWHYYHKDSGDALLLANTGEISNICTRRYANPQLWNVFSSEADGGFTGTIAIQEEETGSTVFWADKLIPMNLPEYVTKETTHKKCENTLWYWGGTEGGCLKVQKVEEDLFAIYEADRESAVKVLPSQSPWTGTAEEFADYGMRIAPMFLEDLDLMQEELSKLGLWLYAEGTWMDTATNQTYSDIEITDVMAERPEIEFKEYTGRIAIQLL